jgi:multimeric flavodoxin WrbA
MKTLLINGSPRKNGDTMTLLNEFIKSLHGESILINTYEDNIRPCVDCRACWKKPGCAIQDDMQRVYGLLDEVDNVILASPVYFSELTGSLLSFASRLQTYYAARCIRRDKAFQLKAKNGMLILTAGAEDQDMQRPAETAHTLFKHMNAQLTDFVYCKSTDKVPASQNANALAQARCAALKLNELFEST